MAYNFWVMESEYVMATLFFIAGVGTVIVLSYLDPGSSVRSEWIYGIFIGLGLAVAGYLFH